VALAALLVGNLLVFRRPLFQGNFGVVDPDRVYRSAQPGKGFETLIREKRLASVLNLRAGSPADPFYAEETRTTRELKVDFFDFPMSATQRPSRRELLVLLDLFKRCKYPLLIHCKQGSDRTGLVTALYLMAVRGQKPERAIKAFSLEYGHIPLFGTKHLHEPIDEYARWLKEQALPHTPERFEDWVKRDYRSADPPAMFRPLRPGPREQVLSGSGRAKGEPSRR
jgi:protein tyrosine phosphatase (PTP) superfamily phosphohydrolase (DUF442 family)